MYGRTSTEILYAILLALCDYIAEGMELISMQSALDLISYIVGGTYKYIRRQSEHNITDLGLFKNGLMSVKSLKTRERLSRIYFVFLALSNSYIVKYLCTKKRKSSATTVINYFSKRIFIFNWRYSLIPPVVEKWQLFKVIFHCSR